MYEKASCFGCKSSAIYYVKKSKKKNLRKGITRYLQKVISQDGEFIKWVSGDFSLKGDAEITVLAAFFPPPPHRCHVFVALCSSSPPITVISFFHSCVPTLSLSEDHFGLSFDHFNKNFLYLRELCFCFDNRSLLKRIRGRRQLFYLHFWLFLLKSTKCIVHRVT